MFIQINIFFITIYAAIQMFGVSNVFFKEINIFIQQRCVKFIKSDSKDILFENIYILK